MQSVLEVKNLTKTFNTDLFSKLIGKKQITIVDHLSFTLKKGEILGLLGPNGAGKTTTIQMLLSTLSYTSGDVTYFGKDFLKYRNEILQKIAFASTYIGLPQRLTVEENMLISGRLYGFYGAQLKGMVEHFLQSFNLWDRKTQETGSLSAGQNTRLMLARAFMVQPEIVLLDEPTASLDPDVSQQVLEFIKREQQERNIAIFFTSHDMDEVMRMCGRVLVLKNGRLFADDTPQNLAKKVSAVKVSFVFEESEKALLFFKDNGFIAHQNCCWVVVELEEHHIASLLMQLSNSGLMYSSIEIKKPTLEDYFLSISDLSKGAL